MRLQAVNNYKSFQIQLAISHFHSQALSSSFPNFHWTSVRFHGPQYGRIPLDYKLLKADFEGIVLLSKVLESRSNYSKQLELESSNEVQFVIDICRFVS